MTPPVEETLEALHAWTRFVSMQPHYNLMYREEEREILPLCQAQGIGYYLGARWRVDV
jgi:aryl-alcohol dehydrogenase-like predicted oxidoreductase